MIITIDGPSGTGKSTVAKRVSQSLGFVYFDTGAMFRALAYGVLKHAIDYTNAAQLTTFLERSHLSLKQKDSSVAFYLNDEDVTSHLRSQEVTRLSSKISTLQEVRQKLAQIQRELGHKTNAVFEGRDMGTVIFPDAKVKIFLTAAAEIRAKRRYDEIVAKESTTLTLEEILRDIKERDHRDENRAIAPLKPAPDAHIIDTSLLTIDQVVEKIISLIPTK